MVRNAKLAREGDCVSNDELFQAAVKAAGMAYSKYSGFSVGAALLTDDGKAQGMDYIHLPCLV